VYFEYFVVKIRGSGFGFRFSSFDDSHFVIRHSTLLLLGILNFTFLIFNCAGQIPIPHYPSAACRLDGAAIEVRIVT